MVRHFSQKSFALASASGNVRVLSRSLLGAWNGMMGLDGFAVYSITALDLPTSGGSCAPRD